MTPADPQTPGSEPEPPPAIAGEETASEPVPTEVHLPDAPPTETSAPETPVEPETVEPETPAAPTVPLAPPDPVTAPPSTSEAPATTVPPAVPSPLRPPVPPVDAPPGEPATTSSGLPNPHGLPEIAVERPEVAVGAAFAGGLVLALILKRLGR